MASKTCIFFESGTSAQFEFVLSKYQDAMNIKAQHRSNKPETLLKLDKWYQNELPKKIKSRGNEKYITHEEIVQTIKWKLARGQFRPRLKDLVQMNTPRVVMQETKKAFRALAKKNDLEAAVQALSNLKGVGPAMASAVLAAGAPEVAPFMADECLLAMPDIEGIDYTMKEYLKLVEKTKQCVERLNSQGGDWTPHKVELAVWTHYVAKELKPELLDGMPGSSATSPRVKQTPPTTTSPAADAAAAVNGSSSEAAAAAAGEEDSRDSGVVEGGAETPTEQQKPEQSEKTENSTSNGTESADKPAEEANGSVKEAVPAQQENGVKDSSQEEDKQQQQQQPPKEESEAVEAVKENGVAEQQQQQKVATEEAVKEPSVDQPKAVEPAADEAAKENGVQEPVQETPSAEENGSSETVHHSNGESTKEAVAAPAVAEKRSLEEADPESTLQSEPKRLKDDISATPIPAGGE